MTTALNLLGLCLVKIFDLLILIGVVLIGDLTGDFIIYDFIYNLLGNGDLLLSPPLASLTSLTSLY